MMTTIEGIYKDGRVEFTEASPDMPQGRVLVTFLHNGKGSSPAPKGEMIRRGMFPELQALTEEDFKGAEFHGDPDDGLD